MLPRMKMFKEVIFTPRIIAFNESFVITRLKQTFPTAVIWHEALSGRSTQDITSTFYAYLLSIRDDRHVILWLDNCSSQNKNWTLFSFSIHIINSEEVSLESLRVKYFEPGHTFYGDRLVSSPSLAVSQTEGQSLRLYRFHWCGSKCI